LPDLLNFVLKHQKFTVDEIRDIFYFSVPDDFKQFKKKRSCLRELRNDIAHYNFVGYLKNKENYKTNAQVHFLTKMPLSKVFLG